MTSLRVLTAAIACVFAAPLTASAAQIILTQNVSGSGTGSASNLNPTTFLSDSFLFNQFDPAFGNLTSAQLEWDFATSATVTPPAPVPNGSPNPFMSGTVQFTFLGDSVSGSFTNATTVQNFIFTGPDGSMSLALAPLIGTGTFTAGTLAGILDLASPTLFPVGVSGQYLGTLELTYVFEPVRNQVPEPATLLLMGGGLATATAARRRQRSGAA
jgi:hypothetical protein